MKTQTWTWTLIIVTITVLAGIASGAAPTGSANVGQTDLEAWSCPLSFPQPTFSAMPIGVSLTTIGGPVLLSLTLNTFAASSSAQLAVELTVDQAPINADLQWNTNARQLSTLTRVVTVSAGAHTFGADIACISGDAITVTRAWLSAYELPLIRK
jgi:hypothetical protein